MKIEDPRSVNSSPNLHHTAPAGPAAARPEATRPNDRAVSQPAARVELSSRSREMHQALEAAHAAPDVRSDKVNDAKQRPLIAPGLADFGTLAFACQEGSGKVALTPPPVAPSLGRSFHTTSLPIAPPLMSRLVPPHARLYGLDAGKSTWSEPSVEPSVEPLSPQATHTVTPTAAADCNAVL